MRRQGQENQARGAGALSQRFSGLEKLELQMEFVSREGHILSSEKRVFNSGDTVNLTADCPGRCGNGRMALDERINRLAGGRQTHSETRDACQELIHVGASEVCGCELHCKISLSYAE